MYKWIQRYFNVDLFMIDKYSCIAALTVPTYKLPIYWEVDNTWNLKGENDLLYTKAAKIRQLPSVYSRNVPKETCNNVQLQVILSCHTNIYIVWELPSCRIQKSGVAIFLPKCTGFKSLLKMGWPWFVIKKKVRSEN